MTIQAAIFDVDGTIVDSTEAIIKFWKDFVKDKPEINSDELINNSHGCRIYDSVLKYAPNYANRDKIYELEKEIPDKYGENIKEIPGSVKLVTDIINLSSLEDRERIAIGTSGTNYMATKWFEILGLTKPKVFITSESVKNGKPDPEPYLLCRKGLGYEGYSKTVVFEDAPAGIQAGKSAGSYVIGIASTFTVDQVISFGADIVVSNLNSVKVNKFDKENDNFELLIFDYEYFVEDRFHEYGFKIVS